MRFASVCQLLFRMQLIALGIALCVSAPYALADDAQEATSSARSTTTLITHLGDRLPGRWLATNDLETIEWQAEGFVQPFRFQRGKLFAVQFRHAAKVPQIEGTYRCEFANGDVLYGTPLAINETEFLFDLPNSGPLRIERSRLRKLSPWINSGQEVSSTPTALNDWSGSHFAWQEAAGRLTAVQDNAELMTTLRLGNKSQTSIRIAWDGPPDFRIDFGSDIKWNRGLRIETWQEQLVLVVESPQAADIVLVSNSVDSVGELLLNVLVDTRQQTILVASEDGETLGELAWQGGFESEFRIQARKKGLHFYSATVTPWDGSSPELQGPVQPRVRYKDGKTEQATITAWNPESQTWTLVIEGDSPDSKPIKRQVSSDQIDAFLLAGKVAQEQDSVQVVSRTGMKFSGEIVRLKEHAVELRCRGVKDPFTIPLGNLRGIVFLRRPDSESTKPAKFPRLQIGDASIVGQLVDGQGDDQATALVWKPSASKKAAAVSHSASGTITYREPPPPPEKPKAEPVESDNGIFGGIVKLFAKAESLSKASKTSAAPSGPTLYLRSGDSIPCQPKRIDHEGVTFASTVTEATFAPQETIKALVLVDNFQPARMTQEQRDRLLTLPRIQQEYPPTHLLLSVDGDLLRARITAMDDKFVTSEVRLNPVKIPRERIVGIAWLHQDELQQGDENEPSTNLSDPFLRVQAVQSDGIRLTFRPQEFVDGTLLGKSDVFGNCRVEVSQVDQFLFGQAIKDALKHQSHQLLTLMPAIVPRFVTADDSAPADAGEGSALVGKVAPPINLKDLKGSSFDLPKRHGKVVVLDFWATWCGPCIQWMPQLEEIVADYSDEEVELVTINLLQEKEVIEPVLERMQLSPTVLLDLDGVVADAYQATAIPQTVIIDRDGKVARLFVGGGSAFADQVRTALQSVVGGEVPEGVSTRER